MANVSLFDLKEKLFSFDTEIKTINEWLAEKAADPTVPMSDIKAKQDSLADLTERRSILQKQHDNLEEQQRNAVALQKGSGNGMTEKDVLLKNKAAFYRAVALGDKSRIEKAFDSLSSGTEKGYAGLGAIPANSADLGSGSHLLPTNLSREIITEPYDENSLRGVEQTSMIAGLEEPRVEFEIDEDELLEDVIDAETAKEIEVSSDVVTYGRYKTKLRIKIADTVVYGSDTNIVDEVENALRSAMARKEKLRAFARSADDDHKHMSFYMVGIKGITGANIVSAIIAAIGDLPDIFRANAKVVMRAVDWFSYVQTMVNGADTLYGKKPEDVIGVPVIFNDRAVIPIVGDFKYAKQNYDPGAILDSDKDIDAGMFKFVLTAWGDHQIKLKSAFRLATTSVALIGGVAKSESDKHLAGEKLKASPVFNTDDGSKPTSGVTYLWQHLSNNVWTDCTNSYTGYNTDELTTTDNQDEGVTFRCKITYNSVSAFTNAIKMA